jgi:hypothetical protein
MRGWGLRSMAGKSKWVLVADTGCWWLYRGIGGPRTGAGGWKAVLSDSEWWKGGACAVIRGAGGSKRVLVGGWWVETSAGGLETDVSQNGYLGVDNGVLVAHVNEKASGNSKKNTPRVEMVLVA